MQSLLDIRPAILAYNRDGKLQAVSDQCHAVFTTLTPCVQRSLHENTVPQASELMWACQARFSDDSWVSSWPSVLAQGWALQCPQDNCWTPPICWLHELGSGDITHVAGYQEMPLGSQLWVRKPEHCPQWVDEASWEVNWERVGGKIFSETSWEAAWVGKRVMGRNSSRCQSSNTGCWGRACWNGPHL